MPTGSTLSLAALNRATLARQLLLAREKATPLATVARLAGMQAQVARPPFVGLWTRLEGFTREQLRKLLKDRKIVRSTFVRGTLHLVTAADYLALRPSLQPMLSAGMKAVLGTRFEGIELAPLLAAARAHLESGPKNFDVLRDHLATVFPKWNDRAMGYAVRTHLPLVQVPTDDDWSFPAQADFALADAWLGEAPKGDPSPQALVRRYLAAFGPATATDAQAWSGMAGLKAVLETMRPELVTFRDERKRELFDLPTAPRPDEDTPAPVRFVPDFDNLVLAHDDRSRVIADEHRGRVVTKNLLVRATFLVDGFVAGTWKIDRRKAAATLVLEPFGTLPKKVLAGLEDEGERLLAFVEADANTREISFAA